LRMAIRTQKLNVFKLIVSLITINMMTLQCYWFTSPINNTTTITFILFKASFN